MQSQLWCVSERQNWQRGIAFALPVKASLYRAGSGVAQSREWLLAACRRYAASYEAQAVPSKFRLARTIVRKYARNWGAFWG